MHSEMLNPRHHPHDGPDPGVPLWVLVLAAAALLLGIAASTRGQEAPMEQLDMTLYAVVDDRGATHSCGAHGRPRRDPDAVVVLFREQADAVAVRDSWNAENPGRTASVLVFTGRTGRPEVR